MQPLSFVSSGVMSPDIDANVVDWSNHFRPATSPATLTPTCITADLSTSPLASLAPGVAEGRPRILRSDDDEGALTLLRIFALLWP